MTIDFHLEINRFRWLYSFDNFNFSETFVLAINEISKSRTENRSTNYTRKKLSPILKFKQLSGNIFH